MTWREMARQLANRGGVVMDWLFRHGRALLVLDVFVMAGAAVGMVRTPEWDRVAVAWTSVLAVGVLVFCALLSVALSGSGERSESGKGAGR